MSRANAGARISARTFEARAHRAGGAVVAVVAAVAAVAVGVGVAAVGPRPVGEEALGLRRAHDAPAAPVGPVE